MCSCAQSHRVCARVRAVSVCPCVCVSVYLCRCVLYLCVSASPAACARVPVVWVAVGVPGPLTQMCVSMCHSSCVHWHKCRHMLCVSLCLHSRARVHMECVCVAHGVCVCAWNVCVHMECVCVCAWNVCMCMECMYVNGIYVCTWSVCAWSVCVHMECVCVCTRSAAMGIPTVCVHARCSLCPHLPPVWGCPCVLTPSSACAHVCSWCSVCGVTVHACCCVHAQRWVNMYVHPLSAWGPVCIQRV